MRLSMAGHSLPGAAQAHAPPPMRPILPVASAIHGRRWCGSCRCPRSSPSRRDHRAPACPNSGSAIPLMRPCECHSPPPQISAAIFQRQAVWPPRRLKLVQWPRPDQRSRVLDIPACGTIRPSRAAGRYEVAIDPALIGDQVNMAFCAPDHSPVDRQMQDVVLTRPTSQAFTVTCGADRQPPSGPITACGSKGSISSFLPSEVPRRFGTQ